MKPLTLFYGEKMIILSDCNDVEINNIRLTHKTYIQAITDVYKLQKEHYENSLEYHKEQLDIVEKYIKEKMEKK